MEVFQIYIESRSDETYRKKIEKIVSKTRPDLFIVLAHYNFPIKKVLNFLSSYNIPVTGGTTSDVIAKKGFGKNKVVITCVRFSKSKVKVFLAEKNDILNKREFSAFIKNFISMGIPKLIFSFISYINFYEIETKFELLNRINNRYPIIGFGGIMGGHPGHNNKLVFYNNRILDNALLYVAVYNDNLKAKTLSLNGYKTIGPTFVVTRVNKNKICEINDSPALDFYLDFYGPLLKKKKDILKYPIAVLDEYNKIDFLRAIVDFDEEEKSLITRGRVFENMKFKILISNPLDMLEDVKERLRSFVENLNFKPKICFIVECNGRRDFLGDFLVKEHNIISNILKDVKIITGFFSSGEIFGREVNNNGKKYETFFLNNTINFLFGGE